MAQALQRQVRLIDLHPSIQKLISLAQEVFYGKIENIAVHEGLPSLEPRPKVTWEIKLGSGQHDSSPSGDFIVKAQVLDLVDHLQRLKNGTIRCIEVQNGLPFRLILESQH